MNGKDRDRAILLDDVLSQVLQRKASVMDSLRSHPEFSEELRPLLETAEQAARLLRPASPSPEFLRVSETRLLRKIRTAARKDNRPQRTVPFARLWARVPATAVVFVLAAALVLGSGWGVTAASAQALPGDTLFPVKLGLEQAELAVSVSDVGDVSLLTEFADRRVEEIQALAEKERFADLEAGFGEYEKALDRLDSAAAGLPAGGGLAQLEDIESRLDLQADVLAGVRDRVPPQAQIALDRVMERSKKSKDLAEQLRREKDTQDPPPGQAKKTQGETGNGKAKTKNSDSTGSNRNGPKATHTKKPTHTPKPSNTTKPSKTPKTTKTDKPSETKEAASTEKPTKTPKPTKDK